MSYLKDREIWLSNVPTGNPPVGYFWKFIQNGKVVVRDSSGNNQIMVATSGSQAITGSLTVTGGITGTVSSASYVEYSNVANKPALVSGSAQITYSGLTGIPSGIVSGSSQVTYSDLTGIPSGIVSGSSQVTYSGLTDIPSGIVSGSSQVTYSGLSGIPSGIISGSAQISSFGIFATTGSNGFNGSQSITGSLTVTGQVVAQTLNVQQVTSSIVYSSGSNIFGNSTSNTQQFTGSMLVTGSLTLNGGDLQLRGTATVQGNTFAPIDFYNSGNNAAAIRPIRFNDETAADLTFWTRAYLGSITERMRIAYDGNIGMGVSSLLSPGGSRRLLQISNSTNGALIALGSSTTESNNPRIFSGQFDLGFAAGVTTGNIDFYTNDQLRLTIASTGAATFSSRVTARNGTSGVAFETTNAVNADFIIETTSGGLTKIGTSGNALGINVGGGNVGIGTPSPDQKLVVSGTDTILSVVDTRSFAAGVGGALYLLGNYRSVGDVTVAGYIKGSKVNSTDGDYGFDLIFATQQYTGGVAERFRITSTGVLKSLPTYNNTTGVAANMQIDSNGFFARSTSSLKYKKDIRDYDKGLDLINLLRPVYYKGKSESDGDKQFAGLIAEEVHDLGLTEFVQYAPDGSPDALSYQNMIALAVKAIQEQQTLIESLKSRIEILEQ